MILDFQNLLSDQQAITGAAGTTVSTNKINLNGGIVTGGTGGFLTDSMGNTTVAEIGNSDTELLIQVTEQFAGGDSVEFVVCTDDDAALGSPVEHATTGAIAIATLKPGYQVSLPLPRIHVAANKHLGMRYKTLGAGAMSAGKITCGIVRDRQSNPQSP